MSRNDIANYLGLAVETVSRLFSRLQDDGILVVRSRHVRLRDMSATAGSGAASRVANRFSALRAACPRHGFPSGRCRMPRVECATLMRRMF
ncbi:MAG: helix-turn-helix domain-containing protein [Chromatiales bacterium]|nr:helix-turn-helix domain-containing protein [Chromatiales bacterium]